MQGLIKNLLLIPFLFFTGIVCSQDTEFLKNFLTVEDGLSNNEVTSIVQDHDGFIWIGTRGGLNRYDGYEFKVFNQIPGDSNSMVNPSVEKLFVDSKGNIWIGTKSGGVSQYNPATDKFRNFVSNYKSTNDKIIDNRVLCFNEDNDGRIWMGTWGNGVIIYDPKLGSFEQHLPGEMINSIVKTSDSEIWIGSENNLHQYNVTKNEFNTYQAGSCQEITFDEKNKQLLLVQGSTYGFRRFELKSHKSEKLVMPAEVSNLKSGNHSYESILLDSEDRCWLGTWGTGLYTYSLEKNQFSRYLIYPDNRGTLNKDYDAILDIFEDKDGNIWLGTNGGGVCVLTKKLKFNNVGYHPEPNKGLTNTRIMSVIEDRNDKLWLGTIGSGLVWSPDRENFYSVAYPGIIDNSQFFTIKNLFEDKDGRILAGTGNTVFEIEFENQLPQMTHVVGRYGFPGFGRQIVSFLDAFNMLWLGSLQHGLFLFDKTNEYTYIKRLRIGDKGTDQQKSNRISYLLKDRKNTVWAGTYNGLHVFNPDDSTLVIAEEYFKIEGEFTGNIITCIDEDSKGNLWIGTPNGLNKLHETNPNVFEVEIFTESDGLASNFIKGISHDRDGNIWFSTNVGISKLSYGQEVEVVNFDETDGVNGKNFTEASVYRNKKGEIFFGGTDGLTYFHPRDIIQIDKISKPVFTRLNVLNKPVQAGDEEQKILERSISRTQKVTLSYRQNNFELGFSALDYRSMGGNGYKYKLENHDNSWNFIGSKRYVNFNNLRPGEYKLLVSCSNSHNVWNDEPAELYIEITPPIWQTWYALLLYILLVVGIATIIRWNAIKQTHLANNLALEKLQHEQDQKLNELKLRFFTNLSHEFRTPLTLILAPLKELLGQKEEYGLNDLSTRKIEIVQSNSQRLLRLVNQLLDFRKVESGNMKLKASKSDLSELVQEICLPFYELARINSINFSVNGIISGKDIWVDRDKLETIVNNLVSNAFKHVNDKGAIQVQLQEDDDEVFITVSDTGAGIAATEMDHIFERFYRIGQKKGYGSSGIGLALVKRFAELHHGKILVKSEPNIFTEFKVCLPKGSSHLDEEEMVKTLPAKHTLTQAKTFVKSGSIPVRIKNKVAEDRILVVEDNLEVSNYLVSVLSPMYQVTTAMNGEEAYKMISEEQPDLVLSDVMMPKMDGFEFCKKVKSDQELSTIPFVFLTAKSDEQFKLLGTQLGADDFISKPFDPNLLLEKVKNLLEGRKKLQKQYSKSVRLEPSDIEITSAEEILLEKALQIVEANLQNEKFTAETLAGELNMSGSTLYRRLKALTNTSTAEFIRNIRIKRAAQLLAIRDKTITEIAYEVGFNDVKHFRGVFQKHFSCSPSEYRDKL